MSKATSFKGYVDESTYKKAISFYSPDLEEGEHSYLHHGDGFVVTLFKKVHEGKGHVILIQGKDAASEARIWGLEPVSDKPKKETARYADIYPQIGSDEVGTGDFFGPIVVAATFVKESDIAFLKELGVTDSKALTDERIREIAPKIAAKLTYVCQSLSPSKLNSLPYNLNEVKARMHDSCYRELLEKGVKPARIYQDQFAQPTTYYRYLKNTDNHISNIVFETKGETKHLSIAAASIIARASFLLKMDELGKEYGVEFPFGAAHHVVVFAKRFYKERGEDALLKVAKKRFKTFDDVIG